MDEKTFTEFWAQGQTISEVIAGIRPNAVGEFISLGIAFWIKDILNQGKV